MKKIQLRKVQPDDHPLLVDWRNQSSRFFFDAGFVTLESHKEWWEKLEKDPDQFFWIIQWDHVDKPVGTIALKVDPLHNHGEYLSFLIAPEWRNLGLGGAGLLELLKLGFGELELHRIFGDVLAEPGSHLNVPLELGFAVEGVFREHVSRDGEYRDVVRLGLLRRDFDYG